MLLTVLVLVIGSGRGVLKVSDVPPCMQYLSTLVLPTYIVLGSIDSSASISFGPLRLPMK